MFERVQEMFERGSRRFERGLRDVREGSSNPHNPQCARNPTIYLLILLRQFKYDTKNL